MIAMKATINKNNVKIFGNPQSGAKTIVFGHGFGTDHQAWRHIWPAFEQEYRIVTYDNVGANDLTLETYSANKYGQLGSYAHDLIDICDELVIKEAVFVGHSVSGMVGLLASKAAPEFFAKHVFMNASPRYLNDDGYVGGFDQSDLDGLFKAMANNYYAWVSGFAPAAMRNPDKPELAHEFAQSLSAIRPDVALAVSKAIFESDHRKDLVGFEKQSIFIQSKNDIAVPMEVGEYLHRNVTNSKLYCIDSEGHFPHISTPKEIIAAIRSFI